MNGAPYLRKVDLRTYATYQELSSGLEKMFSCFTLGKLLLCCLCNSITYQLVCVVQFVDSWRFVVLSICLESWLSYGHEYSFMWEVLVWPFEEKKKGLSIWTAGTAESAVPLVPIKAESAGRQKSESCGIEQSRLGFHDWSHEPSRLQVFGVVLVRCFVLVFCHCKYWWVCVINTIIH